MNEQEIKTFIALTDSRRFKTDRHLLNKTKTLRASDLQEGPDEQV